MSGLSLLVVLVFSGFLLSCVAYLGGRIVQKAGLPWGWTVFLLVPVVNVGAIWVFAFCYWPALEDSGRPPRASIPW